MIESIFEPAGEGLFVATAAALGPWSDQALHGDPPTMLMAREVERFPSDQEMFVTRLTVDLSPTGWPDTACRAKPSRSSVAKGAAGGGVALER